MSSSLSSFFHGASSVFSQLTAAGVTPSAALTDLHNMFGTSSTTSTVRGYLVTIETNVSNPDVVKDRITKIAETPGLPGGVSLLLGQL